VLFLKEGKLVPVESLMRTPPIEASPSEKISTVARMMVSSDIGAAIITVDGKPVGIITEKDIIRKVAAEGRDIDRITAGEVMSSPIITIEHNQPISDALRMMREKAIRRLAVTKRGKLVGIITERRARSLPSLHKIVIPIEESEASDKALEIALNLAKQYFSTVCILSIPPFPKTPASALTLKKIKKDWNQKEEKSRKLLQKALDKAVKADVKAYTRLEYGQPAEKIIQIAEEEDVDLIVIGGKRISGIRKFILSSVADKIGHEAFCPVLIVK